MWRPGLHAGATSLVAEGFELVDVDSIAESFARHLMTAFDLWGEKGFRAVGEDYLERLPKKKAGEKRILDASGDLLTTLPIEFRRGRRAPVARRGPARGRRGTTAPSAPRSWG
jgi:hypothetical protein